MFLRVIICQSTRNKIERTVTINCICHVEPQQSLGSPHSTPHYVVHYRCSGQRDSASGLIDGDSFAAILLCSCRDEPIPHKLWSGMPWETSAMSPGHKPASPLPYLRAGDGDCGGRILHMPEAALLRLLNVIRGRALAAL
jgi:hypothetical protein